jgi:hypothetical protein
MTTRTWLGLLALAAGSAQAEDFRWTGRLSAGQTLEVKGVNGSIEAAGGPAAEVTATRQGRRSDPAEVEIKVVEHAGGVTVCAVYPAPAGRKANSCVPGEGGSLSTRDNDVKVDFKATVPAGVRFAGRTVNGGVKAAGLPEAAAVETVNGSITVAAAGHVEAHTVNGSITASMGQADWEGTRELETVNGSVTVALPASAGCEVEAETVNGSIHTDFDLAVTKRLARRELRGTIGAGGRQLKVQTVNGSIHLRKSS